MLQVLKDNEEALRTVASEVAPWEDVSQLVADMNSTMVKSKGIGLAANQVGVLKRVIVMATKNYTGAIINPVITNRTETVKTSSEGCLSVPNKQAKVKRHYKITVEGFDENWNPLVLNLKQLSAYCAQHEIDHLNGITI
ncbi:polypeptide deformylase [Vibrio phage 1.250.O._10N.261.55.E11]|nr:polypeptide deformylase [Vibrio phage 1.250.O._10N.261.55.E11]